MRDHNTIIVWLREDLRLGDHPAFEAAVRAGGAVVPVFVWSPEEEGRWAAGGASRWWLHHSLARMEEALAGCGSRLVIRAGPVAETLQALCKETGARMVHCSRRYGPVGAAQETRVTETLHAAGVTLRRFWVLLYEAELIATGQGTPYQVFTPFWRRCLAQGEPRMPLPRVTRLPAPARWPAGVALASLGLMPKMAWAGGISRAWTPGEAGAQAALREFIREAKRVENYPADRDVPAVVGTSRLSPYLHFGEIGPHTVWHAVRGAAKTGGEAYLRQLGWREFAQHLLHHFPHTAERPLRADYGYFPWREDALGLRAWQRGQTGYPIIDAGMRQLWETGWMHNRVRMIVASFLVKDLLIAWQAGAAWFWDTLVDADLANNTMGWQWAGGCGADAAPYFRVFNPVLQGEKFDTQGDYVKRYVPELAHVPARWIHKPWLMPELELAAAGVILGKQYPAPIIGHTAARIRALEALTRMQKAARAQTK